MFSFGQKLLCCEIMHIASLHYFIVVQKLGPDANTFQVRRTQGRAVLCSTRQESLALLRGESASQVST